jgi:CBS domain-containing protein
MATSQREEKPEAQADEKAGATNETAVEEEPKAAAEQNTEEKTEQKAQDQQAPAEKANSKESDTAPESDSEKSKPQEPAAENAPAEQPPTEEDTEQAVETDKTDTAEQAGDANENAANQQAEAATEENAADIETDASDKAVEEKVAAADVSKDQPVSETIQRMTQSPATLPGEPASPAQAQAPAASDTICAKDIMQQNIVWGSPDDSVQQALTKIQHDTDYIMIGRDGMLEGIVSKSDLSGAISPYLRPVFAKWRRPMDDATLQIKVKWIMTKPVQTISPETSLKVIIENIRQSHRRALPVVDQQGKVQGLVTVFEIFNALLNSYQNPSIPE